jgi:hypothetical protein
MLITTSTALGIFADSINLEAKFLEIAVRKDVSTIKNKRWFEHTLMNLLKIETPKLIPIRDAADPLFYFNAYSHNDL